MEWDNYSPCFCGSGNKLKFCCPRDLQPELFRLLQLIMEDKRAVAQELLSKLRSRHPRQVCLLALQIYHCHWVPNEEVLQAAIRELSEVSPQHYAVEYGKCLLATYRQQFLEALHAYYRSCGVVYRALSENRKVDPITALDLRCILYLLANRVGKLAPLVLGTTDFFGRKRIPGANEVADQMMIGGEKLPLAVRDWHRDNFAARAEQLGQPALALAVSCCAMCDAWEMLQQLRAAEPQQPWWVYGAGIVRAALGEEKQAAADLRAFAGMPNVEEGWAVSSLMLAEYLDPFPAGSPVRNFVIEVTDGERLGEYLLSDRRFLGDEVEDWDPENGPPPKMMCLLLDRPRPVEWEDPNDVCSWPAVFGRVVFFGKETDRPARLVVQTIGNEAENFLRSALNPFVKPEWRVVGEAYFNGAVEAWLRPRVPPNKSPLDKARMEQLFWQEVERVWMDLPHPYLYGKTPRDAAATDRVGVRAALHLLQLHPFVSRFQIDLAPLWEKFGFAAQQDPPPESLVSVPATSSVSVLELLRLDPAKLSLERRLTLASIFDLYDLTHPTIRVCLLSLRELAESDAARQRDSQLAKQIEEWVRLSLDQVQRNIQLPISQELAQLCFKVSSALPSVQVDAWDCYFLTCAMHAHEKIESVISEGIDQLGRDVVVRRLRRLSEEWQRQREGDGEETVLVVPGEVESDQEIEEVEAGSHKLWLPGDP
ncbi:MAG: hypothetical protein KatS3mg110_4057 [Pirellulaceae bacterium]|nr:MAG: hypothetical protein KatS3mg110_4057 [Pirellulaceae bacterium]